MVKADVRRDYYADLGLQPSAETEDIKKQFRKLGMSWIYKHRAGCGTIAVLIWISSPQVPPRQKPG